MLQERKNKNLFLKLLVDVKFILMSVTSISQYFNFKIPKSVNVVLPRSGVHFVKFLSKLNFKNKKVLDIGTGYFGYLAKHVLFFGAKNVLGVDVNKEAVGFARKNFKSKGVDYRVSNVYSTIKSTEKFDIIISNPPQLPSNTKGNVHDVAGRDGLLVIKKYCQVLKSIHQKKAYCICCFLIFCMKKLLNCVALKG